MTGSRAISFLYILRSFLPDFFDRLGVNIETIHILNPIEIAKSPIDPNTIIAATVVGLMEGIMISVNINYDLSI